MSDTLTEIDVDKLEAGPELDALIAVTFMGAQWITYTWYDGTPKQYLLEKDSDPPHGDDFMVLDNGRLVEWSMTQYSKDIAAAWQVVEHMISRGWCLANFTNAGNRYSVWFARSIAKDEPRIHGYGDTSAPLAICRAALKAVLATTALVFSTW